MMLEIDEIDEVKGDEEEDDNDERIQGFTRSTDRALQGSTGLVGSPTVSGSNLPLLVLVESL